MIGVASDRSRERAIASIALLRAATPVAHDCASFATCRCGVRRGDRSEKSRFCPGKTRFYARRIRIFSCNDREKIPMCADRRVASIRPAMRSRRRGTDRSCGVRTGRRMRVRCVSSRRAAPASVREDAAACAMPLRAHASTAKSSQAPAAGSIGAHVANQRACRRSSDGARRASGALMRHARPAVDPAPEPAGHRPVDPKRAGASERECVRYVTGVRVRPTDARVADGATGADATREGRQTGETASAAPMPRRHSMPSFSSR